MVRVLVSGAVGPGFQWCNGESALLWCCISWISVVVMVRVLASGAVDPGFQWFNG